MPNVAFTTLGCKVNQYETESLTGLFLQSRYQVVDFEEVADVYVINTCSVTHLGEKKSRQLIRRAARRNPAAVIAVTGCYAQVSPEQVAALPEVDVIIGTQNRQRIVELVEAAVTQHRQVNIVSDIGEATAFEELSQIVSPDRTRAFLKIQDGCENFCTYCIIPYSRGRLRSRRPEAIVQEARFLLEQGFREIVLTGIHLGAYGQDFKEAAINLSDAVKDLLELEGLLRLRLSSIESVELPELLIRMMATDSRLCPHLHLPLQSGDDEILQAMNRSYDTAEYAELLQRLRRQIPDLAVTTDVIVGFPGETEQHFNNTCRFVEQAGFSRVHVFPYSRRTGTPAASYSGQIDEELKKQRVHRLQEIAARQAQAFQEQFTGRTMAVLWENETENPSGLTGNYLRVYADPAGKPGEITRVRLEKLYRDGFWGEVCSG
ncbi:MAG TPA: tRNA (N(6)-L-threonylcarbamoyladenosine(37)-C(2))-methylthiotransferase MtaB [Patescibacteria group bacterium]|nr:tRNA (N(6)-L-threonylcarbamoyladenosine(37)-C(2))-methylthiotransferase MtaB [Patescibacteria group bacterium]